MHDRRDDDMESFRLNSRVVERSWNQRRDTSNYFELDAENAGKNAFSVLGKDAEAQGPPDDMWTAIADSASAEVGFKNARKDMMRSVVDYGAELDKVRHRAKVQDREGAGYPRREEARRKKKIGRARKIIADSMAQLDK